MRVHLLEVFYFDGGKFPQPEKLIHSLPFFGLTSPPCGQKRTIVCDSLIKKKKKKKQKKKIQWRRKQGERTSIVLCEGN